MLTFKPPSTAIGTVEVEFDVFFGNVQVLDLVSSWQLLLCLANFRHNLLDELLGFHFQLGLDVVC